MIVNLNNSCVVQQPQIIHSNRPPKHHHPQQMWPVYINAPPSQDPVHFAVDAAYNSEAEVDYLYTNGGVNRSNS